MTNQTGIALIALLGVIVGAFLTGFFSWLGDRRRVRSEDARRWLADRRRTYAIFLGLAESMLREIDSVAIFLGEEGTPISEGDEVIIKDGLLEYQDEWESVLQPAVGEVQLLATPKVADLADRVSGALLDITGEVEIRGSFDAYYAGWFQAGDLVQVLRDAMRQELGLEALAGQSWDTRRPGGWPWLNDRPARESYVQKSLESD